MDGALLRKGAIAGLVAGAVFVMMEMVLVATIGGGAMWGPPRMMGAIVLGEGVLPPPATFDAAVVAVGMMVHFLLSAVLGAVFVALAGKRVDSAAFKLLLGGLFGLVVYVVNFYGMTALFPWFAMARNGITIASHIVFGVVIAALLLRKPA